MHCFSAEHYLVTVRHDDCPAFVQLQMRYMKRPDTMSDESMLIYHVVDGLTDSFFPSLSEMDERIDTLQAEIFSDPREEQLQEVFAMKQRLVGVRRVIAPQRDMFAQLVGNVVAIPGISDETTRYFRDVYDHLIRLSEMIDSYRDLLTGVIDVYLSTIANRRDQIMKQLTVLAAVFLPITYITGFFGQNFGYMVRHIASPHRPHPRRRPAGRDGGRDPRVLQAAPLDLTGASPRLSISAGAVRLETIIPPRRTP